MKPRITDQTRAVLTLIRDHPGIHGWQLMQATDLPSGTVYPILARLENAEIVESEWDDPQDSPGRPPRRCYTLTEAGKRVADAKQD